MVSKGNTCCTRNGQRSAERSYRSLLTAGLFVLCALSFLKTTAQTPFTYWDSIPVVQWGDTIKYPFAGGFNNPQFSTIDMNGDGIEDLFVFERSTNRAYTFINEGTPNQPSYKYEPQYRKCFPPELTSWVLLRDYNCDGKKDIFTSRNSSFAVYRNDYTPGTGLKFTFVKVFDGTIYYIFNSDIPAINDIDNDGDLDILTFDAGGIIMYYFKNLSEEDSGKCDALIYTRDKQCWGSFAEDFGACNIYIADITHSPCIYHTRLMDPSGFAADNSNHPGNTTLALELFGDGRKSLIIGPQVCNNAIMLKDSVCIYPNSAIDSVVQKFTSYPNTNPIYFDGQFPATFNEDVNNDSLKDLIAAPNRSFSEDTLSSWYFKNTGSNSVPNFILQEKDFLQHDMIDVGEGAYPVFFDYDGDSLMDLVIGNYFYFLPGITTGGPGQLALYKNTGTKYSPAFTLITRDFAGIAAQGITDLNNLPLHAIYPAFGDLDGDGDEDMIIGESTGYLHYFTNTAGKYNPANFVLTYYDYDSINVGQFASPQLIDVNGDGKLDLLVGERGGTIKYFENTGTDTTPKFNKTPTNNTFGNVNVSYHSFTGYPIPFLTTDTAGNFQLLVGIASGSVYLYTPLNNDLSSTFQLRDSAYSGINEGMMASICGADIDNDGKMDLAVGNYAGGVTLSKGHLKRAAPTYVIVKSLLFRAYVYPNPASKSDLITIHINGLKENEDADITIYNVLGQIIYTSQSEAIANEWKINLSASNFSGGVYILKVVIPSGSEAGDYVSKFLVRN